MEPAREPVNQCRYGSNCYRKNPAHFKEYSHKHLSDIRTKGKNASNKYIVPDEHSFSEDIILEQLEILDRLFPAAKARIRTADVVEKRHSSGDDKTCSAAKRQKVETETNSRNFNAQSPICSTSTSDKNATVQKAAQQPESRLELKESIKRAFEASKTNNSDVKKSNDVASTSPAQFTADSSKTAATTTTSSKVTRDIHQYVSVVNPKGQMQKKLDQAAPYNFFLTTITDSKPTHREPLSITFQEILDQSLGELESSVQINFMIDIGWLLAHYYFAGYLDKPLLVLYGDETPDLKSIQTKKPQVTAVKVKMDSPFGTHHTKMMLLGYKDGSMRVVVSTANLVEDDWHNRTQGIWMSPRCPQLPDDADTDSGDSKTGFKEDFLRYLVKYNITSLQPWIVRVRRTDFSAINVFFVASVPGGHRETPHGHQWGHPKVGRILSKHCPPIDDNCPIVAQCSSIGSLGPNVQSWIGNDIVNSFRKDQAPAGLRKIPQFKLIYPSFSNVKNSHDDLLGGGCLPYRKAVNEKQHWLKNHMQQWAASSRHRSQAMPHIKTYCRWSDRKLHWFMLTSANMSKAAWGAFNKGTNLDVPLRIMSYEAGVLFLPKFVLDDEKYFPLHQHQNNVPPFPLPYDIPLKPYKPDDTPFFMDVLLR
ncbi:hypothetical protein HA402_005774 [Bradysia odoriphaga]|nr:hypothetical protein HA402_005774 [Bradysia odoriphaga]